MWFKWWVLSRAYLWYSAWCKVVVIFWKIETKSSIRLTTSFFNCMCLDLNLVLGCLLILYFIFRGKIANKYANCIKFYKKNFLEKHIIKQSYLLELQIYFFLFMPRKLNKIRNEKIVLYISIIIDFRYNLLQNVV